MVMGRSGFLVAEVGSGGSESTVDVSPGTRRTTNFWMLCVFWEHESVNDVNEATNTNLYSNPAWWWSI